MEIRLLKREEVLTGLRLAWKVFSQGIIKEYTPEGIQVFQEEIRYEGIIKKFDKDEVLFFGAFVDHNLEGMLELTQAGNIPLLFVNPSITENLEGGLIEEALNYLGQIGRYPRVTMLTPPSQLAHYLQLGFTQNGGTFSDKGMSFLYLEKIRVPEKPKKQKKKFPKAGIVAIIVGIVLLLLTVLFAILSAFLIKNVSTSLREREDVFNEFFTDPGEEGYGDYDEYGDYGEEDEYEESLSGVDAIPEDIKDDLSYEWKDGNYTKEEVVSENSYLDFDVAYPEISGLEDEEVQNIVNDEIKKAAMETVNSYHLQPSQEMKEKLLTADNGYLVSYVYYKVTYASDELISVVFDEQAYTPDVAEGNVHLRTINIDLRDGTVIEAADIIELNDDFLEAFRTAMTDEAQDEQFLESYSNEELAGALRGESDVLVPEFFIDAEGIEIGFDINPSGEDDGKEEFVYAWVTAPFSRVQIEPYEKNSELWETWSE